MPWPLRQLEAASQFVMKHRDRVIEMRSYYIVFIKRLSVKRLYFSNWYLFHVEIPQIVQNFAVFSSLSRDLRLKVSTLSVRLLELHVLAWGRFLNLNYQITGSRL